MAKIQFTLKGDGSLQTKVIGGEGPGCEVLTKAFDDALNGAGTQRTQEPEFHAEEPTKVSA